MRSLNNSILELLGEKRSALQVAEIATGIGIDDRAAVIASLDELVSDGLVRQRDGRRYGLAANVTVQKPREVEGVFHQNPRGFGFLKLVGQEDDVFVPAESVAGAMHGDRVSARIAATGRRGAEAEIIEVLDRARKRVVGVLRGRSGGYRIELDDQRVRGPVEIVEGEELVSTASSTSCAAVAELVRYPRFVGELPKGRLIAVLGEPGQPDVEVLKILLEHAIDEAQPEDAVLEARAYGDACAPAELARREDLRDKKLVTIDPKTARDHDDAVWVERDGDGNFRAWIAIADVSWYVRPNTALDKNALARGNSVYLPDRSIPMLPHELSGNLCSLLPRQDRLCMCVEVTLDPAGKPLATRIYEATMRSHAFLTYDAVARALGFTSVPERDPEADRMRSDLQVMWELSSALRTRRMRRGSLDLDLPESDIVLDDTTRAPIEIRQRDVDPGVRKAYRLIEELMLLANEEVARYVLERNLPSLFRVHGAPDSEKLARFAALCAELALDFDAEAAQNPKSLSAFLRSIEENPKKQVLHMLLLRAMQQAQYDPANIGHFGLASPAYLHFTSPIRRYADLIVHRLLRHALLQERGLSHERGLSPERATEALQVAALTASQRERMTMEAERNISDLYRALYMRSRLGETFSGSAITITQSGVFVQLSEPWVTVLVLFDDLGAGGYAPDEHHLRVSSQRSGDTIALGDTVELTVIDVSLVRRLVYGRRLGAESASAGKGSRATQGERKGERKDAHAGKSKGAHAGKSKGAHAGKSKGKGKPKKGKPNAAGPGKGKGAATGAGKAQNAPKRGDGGKSARKTRRTGKPRLKSNSSR